jgi:hypothetical protein
MTANSDVPARDEVSDERRRLLRGGVAAGSVVMTVASRPVFGQPCLAASAMGSMPTSGHAGAMQTCSGLTPEQWKASAANWPSPYVGAVLGAPIDMGVVEMPGAASTGMMLGEPINMPGIDGSGGVNETQRRVSGSSTTTSSTTAVSSLATSESSRPTQYHSPTTGFGGSVFGTQSMLEVLSQGSGSMSTVGRYMVAALLNARSGRTPVLDESGVRTMWNDLVSRGYYEPTSGIQWGAFEIVAYLRTTMG